MKIKFCLIGIIAGVSILSIPMFFPYRFLFNEVVFYIYKFLVFIGGVITIFFLAKLLKVKFRYFIFMFITIELLIFFSFFLIKNGLTSPSIGHSQFVDFYMSSMRNTPPYHKKMGQYDNERFYKFQPGNHIFKNLEFTTDLNINSLGCRDDKASFHFPKIICIGDSFTMGWGVNSKNSFPDIIEQKTNQKTLNMGIPSYGTAREFLFLEKIALDSCETIVLQFCENDIFENREFIENYQKLNISSLRDYQSLQIANHQRIDYFPFKWTFEITAFAIRSFFNSNKEEFKKSLKDTQFVSKDFFKIVDLIQKDFKGRIIIFNLESFKTTDEYFKRFKSFLKRNPRENVVLFDASKVLETSDYFLIDDHINEEGHRKVADGLINLIIEK